MKLCFECSLHVLIAGLAEQREHVLLVAFDAGLIERIDAEHIAGNCTCLLEEVDQPAEGFLSGIIELKDDIRNAALGMCKDRAFQCAAVDDAHILAGQEVQAVRILCIRLKEQILLREKLNTWIPQECAEPSLSPLLLQITGNREQAMAAMLAEGFEEIRGLLPRADIETKRRLCQLVAKIPKDPWGYYTIRKVLEKTGIAKSTYYALLGDEEYGRGKQRREEREQEDLRSIRLTVEYKGYAKGYRQVYMMLKQVTGVSLSLNRVRTLMRRHGLNLGIRRPSKKRKANRELTARNLKPNILGRKFRLYRPNEVRLTDVTYLDYSDGHRAYGSASIDPVTGRLVCFVVSGNNDLQLALDTLTAMDSYPAVNGGILHSDQGILYFADDFQDEVTIHGLIQSMSRRGNCLDNSPQESFFGHFKDECPYKNCRDLEELQATIDAYRVYYNEERHMWNRMQMTPAAYEKYLKGLSDEQYASYMAELEDEYRRKKEAAAAKAVEHARQQRETIKKASIFPCHAKRISVETMFTLKECHLRKDQFHISFHIIILPRPTNPHLVHTLYSKLFQVLNILESHT